MNRRTRAKFRPLRKFLTILIAIPLTLLFLRLAWGAYADHHLAATRQELAAAGHRTRLEDFTLPSLPDDQNAALPLLEAARSLTLTSDQRKAVNADDHRGSFAQARWTDEEKILIHDAVKSNPSIPILLDTAAQRPQARWTLLDGKDHKVVALFRSLANFLYAQAIVAHEDGHDDLALAHLERIIMMANRLTNDPGLLPHLVAMSIAALPPAGIERIHTNISFSPLAISSTRSLIAALLDDEPFDNQLRAAFECESDSSSEFARVKFPATQSWLILPAFTLHRARHLRLECAMADAFSTGSWQSVKVFDRGDKDTNNLDVVTYVDQWYSNARVALLSYRSATDRHAAAILLAAAIYRADHHGDDAASLDQLIPHYLPTAPMDRFSAPPAPLHYRAAPDLPDLLVWSVGEDGIDNGGSTEVPRLGMSHQRWTELDAVYGPSRLEPIPSTSPAPSFPGGGSPGFGPGGPLPLGPRGAPPPS